MLQGAYFVLTGLWPLVHTRSFLAVTGPKTDIWMLKTLSGLITAVGAVLLQAGIRNGRSAEARSLAAGSALALMSADIYYVGKGTISRVYLLDAAAEALLLTAWVQAGRTTPPSNAQRPRA